MLNRFTLLITLLIQWTAVFSQIPSGYYDAATGSGDVLRNNLRSIITSGHVKLPYTDVTFDVWDAYAVTDVRPSPNNTIVWDMYSDIPSGSPAYTYTIYTDQCGTASGEGDCYSREHQMPNSWWGGTQDTQYSDLHHLLPSDQYVNNMKSNYIVAETTTPTYTSSNGSKVGPCSLTGFTGSVFEPINEYKGDFARAYLYLATRYMNKLSVWRNTYSSYDSRYIIATSGGNYLQWYIDMLVRWHNQDPVSQKEIDRNNNVYYNTPQHNRNPYIDHPEYVCLVWTSTSCSTAPAIINIVHTPAYPNAANTVSVTADITDNGSITSASLQWCTDGTSFSNSITMNLNGAPNYITSSPIPAQAAGTTVSYRIVAVDNQGNATTSVVNTYTVVKNEPSNHPASFSCGTSTSSSIALTWTDATGTVIPDGYLIKASNVSLAAITDPVDGVPEANGSFVKNVAQGLQTVSFAGLTASTNYFFKIYPYSNAIININYKTSPAALTSLCATSAGGSGGGCASDLIISEYLEGSSSNKYIELYNNTGGAIDLSNYKLRLFTNGVTTPVQDVALSGTLNDQTTIVYKNSAATIYGGTATSNTAINFNGNDAIALYKISTASYVDIFGRIGEDPGTEWTGGGNSTLNKTLVRNSSVTAGVTSNPTAGFPTLATEWTQSNQDVVTFLGGHTMACGSSCSTPTVQAGTIAFAAVTQTSMTINWTNGDGSARIVVVKQGNAVSGNPVAGTSYVANAAFGSGNTLNTGEYIVYNGSGSTVSVTNLTAGLTYHIAIFEYNCTAGSQLYLTPAVASNITTYSLITGSTTENQYCITATNGFNTTIDFTSTGTFAANTYTAQLSDASGSFATATNIGTLSSNAHSGTINCVLPANTASGTGYLIRIISNGPSVTGTLSNAFEIVLYAPCTAPTSAVASRNFFCLDDAGSIDLSVTGGSGTTLAWYSGSCNGTLLGTGNPLNIASPEDTTVFYAQWENTCSISTCANVSVTTLPYVDASVSIAAVPTGAICSGTSVTFTASPVNGGTSPDYQWKVNGGNVGTGAVYTSTTLANTDVVTCVMTSNESCVTGSPATSNDVIIAVNEPPLIDLGADILQCSDIPVLLDAGAGYDFYHWSNGSVNQTLSIDSAMNGLGPALYYVLVTDSNTCQASDTILVTLTTCVGIEETIENTSVRGWPNPVGELLHIEMAGHVPCTGTMVLTDLSGAMVYEQHLLIQEAIHHECINMSSLAQGVYQLRITTSSSVFVLRIIHQ